MTNIVEVLVNDANRLVIPAAVRQQLGLAAGMTLIVEEAQSGDVVLHVASPEPMIMNEGGILVVHAEATGNIDEAVERERYRRLDDLLRQAEA